MKGFLALSLICMGTVYGAPRAHMIFAPVVEVHWGPVDSMSSHGYLQEFRPEETACYLFFHRSWKSPTYIILLEWLLLTAFLIQDRLPTRRAVQLCVGTSLLVLVTGAFAVFLNFLMMVGPLIGTY